MPCIKCSNGKWKYGEHGKCVFDTLQACKDAAAAIHANSTKPTKKTMDCGCENTTELKTKS